MNKQYIVDRLIKKAQLKNIPIMGTLSLTPQESQFSLKCPSQNLCTLDEWIKLANEMQKQQVLFLELSGEPLLYPQFQDLYLALKNLGMVLTIHTNAIMIDEEIITPENAETMDLFTRGDMAKIIYEARERNLF